MAYNLQSLITILEQILNPEELRWNVDHNKPRLESLLEKARFLQEILEKSSFTKLGSLERQIRDAAYQAEDIIESCMVHQMLCICTPQGMRFTFVTPYLHKVTQRLDSAKEQVVKLVDGKAMLTRNGASSLHDLTPDVHQAKQHLESLKHVEVEEKEMSAISSRSTGAPSSSSKKYLVGIGEDLLQLKDRLTNMERKLEIIPIVGMGGVGKTTLARKLYEDPLIAHHFDARAWTTISQDYNIRAILLSLLRCVIGKECDQHANKEDNELKHILYQSLYGRRYQIVLDDVWSTKFWDEIRMYFPDNNEGSRIVITTRESGVAKYADSSSLMHHVQLLSKSESWNLLHQLVFGEEDCPLVFQEMGQKIASDCGGLPLAINVIGGLLSKIEKSKDAWEKIGNSVIAAIAQSDEQFSSILSLSYNHLPNHLKPCFLYMGAFPEDSEIKGSTLIRMWVAEGFVKSNGERSLEEEAEDCLKALVERNLLLVREYKYGKPYIYNFHDMLRDACVRKSEEEKFMHVKNGPKVTFSNPRRLIVNPSHGMEDVNGSAQAQTMSLARSLIVIGETEDFELPSGAFSALRLVRVLDLRDMWFQEFPTEIFSFVNLRFLAVHCFSCIPRGISRLWNLQTFIASSNGFYEPSEIWQLPELRNLKMNELEFLKDEGMKYGVLLKLQMIRRVYLTDSAIRTGFLKSIPNIRKLGCNIMGTSMGIDLSHLYKLKILRFFSSCLSGVIFSCNIRKLFLHDCAIKPGELMTLHKLEVLKINRCMFGREGESCDEVWEAADGDIFCSLQFLCLEELRLVRWIADETNFPRLRHLFIEDCPHLKEIPGDIGEIPTLQLIELVGCSDSALASAKRIEDVQQSEYDNYDLKLRITRDRTAKRCGFSNADVGGAM